jgi:hypothetical protein
MPNTHTFLPDWTLEKLRCIRHSIPNTQMTQYPIPNTQYFFAWLALKNYGIPNIQYLTLKNSRVLLYLFFSQKQSCFIVSFSGSKMSVKRDFRSLQNFWVLGIGTLGIASIASRLPTLIVFFFFVFQEKIKFPIFLSQCMTVFSLCRENLSRRPYFLRIFLSPAAGWLNLRKLVTAFHIFAENFSPATSWLFYELHLGILFLTQKSVKDATK